MVELIRMIVDSTFTDSRILLSIVLDELVEPTRIRDLVSDHP